MSAFDPPSAPADSEPGPDPAPSLPASGLWPDSEPAAAAVAPSVPTPVAATASAGTIGHIGRYALKSLIGEGGLGAVYSAHDPLLSRTIAIKTLNVQVAAEDREAFNALFLDEARAAGGLSHPNIVTVYDAGVSDDRVYIAMELLKGRDLRHLRDEGWRPTPAQAALIARRVADALGYAHSKGVVHCDVKPANIFMVGRTQPRVLDFGIARIAHRREAGAGMVAGSPYYMAPEQLQGDAVDRRADVFSLGVVLYEMLTDSRPFRGSSLEEIAGAVRSHVPPLASDVDPRVPRALAEIVARAMEKNPEQRLRSARAFSRELRQWLEEQALGEGATAPATKPARRWLWLGAAAVVGALAGGGSLWALIGSHGDSERTGATVAPAGAPAPGAAAAVVAPRPATGSGRPPADSTKTPATTEPARPATASERTGPAAPGDAAMSPTAAQPAKPAQVAETTRPAAATEASRPAPLAEAAPPAAHADAPKPADPAEAKAAAATPSPAPPAMSSARPGAAAVPAGATAAERRARDARAAAREIRPTPAATGPAIGLVRIAVSPWGQVEVDGTAAGTAPPLAELSLAEGRHQITIRNSDFAPFSTTVQVSAGTPLTVRHRFGP